jgi:hypothetical protein
VTPPPFNRAERAEPFRREILELFDSCKGNLVRVHEQLEASGVKLSYPALTERVNDFDTPALGI